MKLNLKNPNQTVYAIGRASDNDLVIADMAVSRKHGVFTRQPDGSWLYEDVSTNGTTVCTQDGVGTYVHNRTIKITKSCRLLVGMSTVEVLL